MWIEEASYRLDRHKLTVQGVTVCGKSIRVLLAASGVDNLTSQQQRAYNSFQAEMSYMQHKASMLVLTREHQCCRLLFKLS
jgi:hypothetical protein